MSYRRSRKPRPPLDKERLNELALHYVGKYATTRAILTSYLARKVRERGWDGATEPEIERIVQRFAETGIVDDASYALSKSRSLSERGYGGGRVRMALRAAGIDEEDGAAAHQLAEEQAVDAAVKFARRRRLGPFADGTADRKEKERAIGAMVRAGHGFELARAIVNLSPEDELDLDELRTKCR
jgi:regulatory protein